LVVSTSGVTQPLGALRQSATFGPPLLPFGDFPHPPPPVAKKFSIGVPFWESKNFSGHTPIFPKYENIFPETPKNFQDIWYFSPKLKHFSGNNIDWSFQKCALGKKCNFNEFFQGEKRALCNRKTVTCQYLGGPGPPLPPRFLRPWLCLQRILNTNNICILLTIYQNPYQKSQKSQKCAIKFFMVIFVAGPWSSGAPRHWTPWHPPVTPLVSTSVVKQFYSGITNDPRLSIRRQWCANGQKLCSQQSFGRISGGSLREDQSEIRPANNLCVFVFLSRLSDAKFLLAG
jgi:hypothetical protein